MRSMTTSKERFLSRLVSNGDEIPVFLRDLTLSLDIINARTTDVFTSTYDHKLAAKAITTFQRHTGQDAVVGCIQSSAFNVESFGGIMRYPEYGIPIPIKHPFEGLTEPPNDVSTEPSGKMLGAIRSYSVVRSDLPDTAVVANVEGPLTKAGTLAGMEYLAILLIEEKDIANEFIRVAMEHTEHFIDSLFENQSIDAVFLASATDNPNLFGNETYMEFTIPHVKGMIDHVHGVDLPVIFHPHGVFSSDDASDVLESTIRMGIDGFQFAESNDPHKITSVINGRCAVLGGTDIVPTLLHGSADEVRKKTEFYLDACKEGKHIFMPSCSLHRGLRMDNVMMMVETVRKSYKL